MGNREEYINNLMTKMMWEKKNFDWSRNVLVASENHFNHTLVPTD
jgi:hypothetical protein